MGEHVGDERPRANQQQFERRGKLQVKQHGEVVPPEQHQNDTDQTDEDKQPDVDEQQLF